MPQITLTLGRRYAARSPEAPSVRIVDQYRSARDGGPMLDRYIGSDDCVYTKDGNFANHGAESAFDLVEEVPLTRWDRFTDFVRGIKRHGAYPPGYWRDVLCQLPIGALRTFVILVGMSVILPLAVVTFVVAPLPYVGTLMLDFLAYASDRICDAVGIN